PPRQFALLGIAQRPVLWVAGNNDAGVIYKAADAPSGESGASGSWSAPTKLSYDHPIASPRGRAFVFAAGNLRLYVEEDAERIAEECYTVAGARKGAAPQLAPPRLILGPNYSWSTFVLAGLVLFVMLGSTRRRAPEDEIKIGDLPLAPWSLRLF